MPKMKTKKTFAKRVKVTGTGKLRKYSNYVSHFATNKTHKQLKHLHIMNKEIKVYLIVIKK